MTHTRALLLGSVLATTGCSAGTLPTLELRLSHTLASGHTRGAPTEHVRSWVSAGLRWHERRAAIDRADDAAHDRAAAGAERLDATCDVDLACRWERAARARALVSAEEEAMR